MREIEVKAKVHDKDSLITKLKSHGVELSVPLKQRDIVYHEPGALPTIVGSNFLRVRIENDKNATFTLKQTVKDLDKIEHETEISDATEMLKIIELLHYEPFNDLTKIRQKGTFKDYEICLDEVENLGIFVELEKLADDDADGEAVKKELWQALDELGIREQDHVTKGYDVLMREKLAESGQ